MKRHRICLLLILALSSARCAEWKENEHGVVGYDDTAMLPWAPFRKHDSYRPQPPHVEGKAVVAARPADALALFDGTGLEAWKPGAWTVRDGVLVAGMGYLETKEAFGSCQVHLEFRVPEKPDENLGNRGNSGVFPMGFYEIQIFDSHPMHKVQIYADGQCAAIYGETPPRVNACARPGQWQSFDLVFTAPVFTGDKVTVPARVTLLHNGIPVHLNEEVHGRTGHRAIEGYKPHAEQLPLKLQGHGSRVEFRNIWIRKL